MAALDMTRVAGVVWRKLGSIHLTVVVCLALAADLTWGYLCLTGRANLFSPLNQVGLGAWMNTYGRNDLAHAAWFFILLGLLTLLCVNTFVCTTDRVAALVRARARFSPGRLLFRLAPHIMHYAVILLLTGYLSSYVFAQVPDMRTLVPGGSLTLPGTSAQVTFESFEPVYYTGGALPAFENRVLKPRSRLRLTADGKTETAVLSCARPVHFKGFGIFLKDFAPKIKGGMAMKTRIDLTLRKDPGVPLYLAGIGVFCAGLVLYLADWIFIRKGKKDAS